MSSILFSRHAPRGIRVKTRNPENDTALLTPWAHGGIVHREVCGRLTMAGGGLRGSQSTAKLGVAHKSLVEPLRGSLWQDR